MTLTKQLTRSEERMHSDFDWLNSRHSFSFGGHYDPERMGFGPLRVVNDDIIAPSGGFPSHPHRDMEIITLVLDGQLQHKDSLGNGRVIQTGDIQYMSAGSGVVHSEFNPSADQPVHIMQIWIQPSETGLEPRYADQPMLGAVDNEWKLILSPDGREGSMAIRQDAELRTLRLSEGKSVSYVSDSERRGYWIFVLQGAVQVGGEQLLRGDSLALTDVADLDFVQQGTEVAQVMLFDLPID
ncbi:pirin family protein [Coraliomargarita sp. SDUM461003]|uniref:Pirin family protein n=1 Tax=Thalassobacterium maritimum TaxID=3041265 RepID=A0ABU1AYK8_9BACT|nr:pirin family protein [Coraliomargarita sp. SDUM461003]MDQ8209231.1 pirin family protein [Coraliomargarita sp. SDUM461003]